MKKITLSVEDEVFEKFKKIEKHYKDELNKTMTIKRFGPSAIFQHWVNKDFNEITKKKGKK